MIIVVQDVRIMFASTAQPAYSVWSSFAHLHAPTIEMRIALEESESYVFSHNDNK